MKRESNHARIPINGSYEEWVVLFCFTKPSGDMVHREHGLDYEGLSSRVDRSHHSCDVKKGAIGLTHCARGKDSEKKHGGIICH